MVGFFAYLEFGSYIDHLQRRRSVLANRCFIFLKKKNLLERVVMQIDVSFS